MTNVIHIKYTEPTRKLSHGGEREVRYAEIWVNGKLWGEYGEYHDSEIDYVSGRHFDKALRDIALKLQRFFGGVIATEQYTGETG